MKLKALGKKVTGYSGLETFKATGTLSKVTLISDEVTAVCPVTGQPDWYKIEVCYIPNNLCIESKTFKLFLHSLREKGIFCESLSSLILQEVLIATKAKEASVIITQKPRGGVSIIAVSEYKGEVI